MIVLAPNPTFEAPVKLTLPGSTEQEEVTFTFKVLSRKHTISFLLMTGHLPATGIRRIFEFAKLCWRRKKWATMVDMIDEIVAGWQIAEPSVSGAPAPGFDLPYGKESVLTLLLESPSAPIYIFHSYMENLEKARRKN